MASGSREEGISVAAVAEVMGGTMPAAAEIALERASLFRRASTIFVEKLASVQAGFSFARYS